jgi:hypothetical protein
VLKSGWSSAIVPDFPKLFEGFKPRKFALLWRGSRDGFKAKQFHRHCDGHPNTLTVILDTNGNIFGAFTPIAWESSTFGKYKTDPSLTSFLFTLKNPHNVAARRFALKAEKKESAIYCDECWGPCFCDIGVADLCHTNNKSYTWRSGIFLSYRFGDTYTNNTGLDGKTFFTGSDQFQVKQIEVFEITN